MTKELNYDTHDQVWEVKEAIKMRVAKTEVELQKLLQENTDDVWSDFTERKIFTLVERKEHLMFILKQL
jgi:hypothetical protein